MLSIEHENRLCLITIDRPPVNALNLPLLTEITGEITLAATYDDHALVISGVSNRFCAGLDTKAMAAATRDERAEIMAALSALLAAIAWCPIPTAAAITGHCLGGGLVSAALCDYRVMAEGDYKTGLPEVNMGIELPGKVHRILARLVGDNFAQRLCVEGLLLDPGKAHRANLVDDLAEPEDVRGAAIAWCKHMLSLPGEAMLAMRTNFREDLLLLYDPPPGTQGA